MVKVGVVVQAALAALVEAQVGWVENAAKVVQRGANMAAMEGILRRSRGRSLGWRGHDRDSCKQMRARYTTPW